MKVHLLNFPIMISSKSCLFLFVLGDEAALGMCYLPVRWNLFPVNFHSQLYLQKRWEKTVTFYVLCEGFACSDLGTKQKLWESKQPLFLASPRALQQICARMHQLQLFTVLPALCLCCSVFLQLRENLFLQSSPVPFCTPEFLLKAAQESCFACA